MLGADVRQHADLGLRDRAEVGELADLARAELAHAERVPGLEPEEREGHAEAVVVVGMGREGRHVGAAERGEDVLRGRLAIRAGHPDHLPTPRPTHVAREHTERGEGIVDLDHGDVARGRSRAVATEHGGRARGDRLGEERVPVDARSLERAEERARPSLA